MVGGEGDLTGLHEHFETLKLVTGLDVGFGREELGNEPADTARRRFIGNFGADDGAPACRRIFERNLALGLNLGVLGRLPTERLPLDIRY